MIKYKNRMGQLINFKSLDLGGGKHPTDLDAYLEWKDKGYIFMELKYDGAPTPRGQELALERLVIDTSSTPKEKISIAIIADHYHQFTHEEIDLGKATVRLIYYSVEKRWRKLKKEMFVDELVNELIDIIERGKQNE